MLGLLILLLGAVSVTPTYAQQADLLKQTEAFAGEQGADFGEAKDPRLIAALIVRVLLGLMGTLFLVYAIYGGVLIMISGGNEDRLRSGQKAITQAVIGILVILSSWSITRLVARIGRANDLAEKDCVWVEERSGYYIVAFTDIEEDRSRFFRKTDPLAHRTIGKYVPCSPDPEQ